MTKAAVFDLDGVLLDSMGIWNDLGARYLRSQLLYTSLLSTYFSTI